MISLSLRAVSLIDVCFDHNRIDASSLSLPFLKPPPHPPPAPSVPGEEISLGMVGEGYFSSFPLSLLPAAGSWRHHTGQILVMLESKTPSQVGVHSTGTS